MHLHGYRFAPRIRNIGAPPLHTANDPALSELAPLIGGTISTKTITAHREETLALATSIKKGSVTRSPMMHELAIPVPKWARHRPAASVKTGTNAFLLD
jgi:TnpA family transposase